MISYICIISYLEKPWKKPIQRDTLENTIDKSIQDLKKSLSNRGADKKKKKEKYKPRRNKENTKNKMADLNINILIVTLNINGLMY